MLKALIVAILVASLAMGIFYAFWPPVQGEAEPEHMDTTGDLLVKPESMATAEHEPSRPRSGVHLSSLDLETRAQDDFYQFANGGWLDNTEIPEIYSGYTVYHQVNEVAEVALRKIIEDAGANPGETGSEAQKIGDYFASWMDEETINSLGISPIQVALATIAGIEDTDQLLDAMGRFYRGGTSMPFGFYIYPDLKDSENYAAYFGQSGLTMPNRDYYLEKDNENFAKAREALPAYIHDLLVLAGYSDSQAEHGANAVYSIEEKIAEVQWDSVLNRDPQKAYNPHNWEELETLAGNFNWKKQAEIQGVDSEDKLIIRQPSYFAALNDLIVDIPLTDWLAYVTYRVMDGSAYHLDQATADIRFAYRSRILSGQQEERPRWKRGISLVNGSLGETVGKLYVQDYFPPEAKAKMVELVENVIETLDESIDDLEWMSSETQDQARVKLSKFTAKIGYPDEWRDYSSLEIFRGDHFGNRRRVNEWDHARQVAKLGEPIDRNEWGMTPQTVNAYYSPGMNEIVFPAARLQPPFFQLNADDAINYGAVGGVIGHEISHGFDDKGSQFNGDGNLVNWWTDEDRSLFEARTKVLVEQYNQFSPVEGMTVNGELTLGENIGDLSGVAMAYRAYIKTLNGKEAPVIDGFTGPQRFFIGYAMSRKGKYKDEATISRLASDTHSPLEFRVNGVYRNIDAFHDAFDTKEGDGMWLAPEDRVKIW
ncbi:MAG: putative endopeptidase [Rhodothermales bacterium]|jgi:putative endopeptidase